MSCSRIFVLFVYHLTLAFLLQKAFGAFNCFSSENFAANSPYESNVNGLISTLSTQTPQTGFGQASVGQSPNQVYGLALCAAYMSSSSCQTCVEQAGNEIRNNCPNNKGAIAWTNQNGDCLLKYSNVEFFGQVDNQNKVIYLNPNTAGNPEAFSRQTNGLLLQLSDQGSVRANRSAAGELQVYGLQKAYGLTQCTRDLSSSACKQCLEALIGETLPTCCNGKEGARVFSGSCTLQYETFPIIPA
ncbi:hypothetical protein like AT3G22060 [Hibiscus trionum]|uniref:Gnk2-homologous domain-containing protein n=1 Tax=Hibiscus trionum TaxID=183268 RepID=A0A9W7IG93_HIBTR|nr:hypothetical protein like AT3G22060 [Hibiscus trionum]